MDKTGKIRARKENFAIIKAKKFLPETFACINDGKEITAIIEQAKINEKYVIDIQRDYKLLSFDMTLPFDLVGFIAKISKALAEEKIPIFVISGYSTDHILIHKKYIEKAKKKLKSLGFAT